MLTREYPKCRIRKCKKCGKDSIGRHCRECYIGQKGRRVGQYTKRKNG